MQNEHIVIADELADHSIEPTRVYRQTSIVNRVRGIATNLTFYDEGCVQVRQKRKGMRVREHLLELRFLNPKPVTSRRPATGFLSGAVALGLVTLATAVAVPTTPLSSYAVPTTIAVATLALLSLLLFIYRSDVRYRFFTASGRAVVISLTASFGCKRKTRLTVKEISDAIRDARQDNTANDIDYLRAEMKAHYKLAETGVISRKACSNGTTLILSKFK